jgi:CDP-diacylglycerol--glycerol-3-phosphate 3-phosphatidyltransferase
MLLVPLLVALVLAETAVASYAAAIVFVAGAFSDGLDGYLARRHHMSTRTGQWLDPLSDKLLVAAPVITLAALGRFPVWGAVVIIAREILITLLRILLGTRGLPMPASNLGKLKTATQLAAITLYLLPLGEGAHALRFDALVVALVMTVVSGLDYVVRVPSALRSVAVGEKPAGDSATPPGDLG